MVSAKSQGDLRKAALFIRWAKLSGESGCLNWRKSTQLDKAARVLERVIRSAGSGTAHLVGLSVGGMIAQALNCWTPWGWSARACLAPRSPGTGSKHSAPAIPGGWRR